MCGFNKMILLNYEELNKCEIARKIEVDHKVQIMWRVGSEPVGVNYCKDIEKVQLLAPEKFALVYSFNLTSTIFCN